MGRYFCTICHRRLTVRSSVARGMGPDCFAKLMAERDEREWSNDVYIGFDGSLTVRLISGRVYSTIPQLYVRHSPTGFGWGYLGSGPADLAFNTLIMFGCKESEAGLLYQRFKEDIVASIPQAGGRVEGAIIEDWICEHKKGLRPDMFAL